MSALVTILGAVFLGTLGPAMFGAWYTVPAYSLPVFLILWKGTSTNALIWGSVSAIAGELACGLPLGTVVIPYIVFFALLYAAGHFISWKPLGGKEKWTVVNALTALVVVSTWHVFLFLLFIVWNALLGNLSAGLGAYAMLWFNIHVLCWVVGTQAALVALCYLTEQRRRTSW